MKFTVAQIAHLLGGTVEGSGEQEVHTLGKIEEAGPGSISFLANPKYEAHLYTTRATAVIVSRELELKKGVHTSLIRVEDPYSSFTRLLEEYHRMLSFQKTGTEDPCFMHQSVSHGEGLYRGAFSYIGAGSKLGKGVKIYPNAYIGENVVIGDNTIILAGAKIYPDTKIGSNCTIHAGAVVGSDGFGFAPQPDGSYKTIPQLGNVVLEDWVSIGANAAIDCATMGSTIIRKGVKIDNLVQVAHNVEIGENTVIAAQSGVAGSTKIGRSCILAGQVGVIGHLQIADKTTIAAQAGVGKSIKQEGKVLIGSPAFERDDYLKSYVVFKNLPDLDKRLKQLEEKIINLRSPDEHS
ncbi:UDP-3-O-(3-hydroxymyristoyl)glucosamine N-acyltransferase [Cesiribacter andamanensis]|uniref:UDP-3-O-acylglucosamine N-acyltransferase n=1 Tax=Cesiribacter andamanensis AMV16 TaxID=1279009 RepID=M7N0T3_9BACT|nr:UDP-3-O-(3-hydroxymyristoyl)glucosamine N-acyltransferase [Cesiribacter andamanensis]EMR00811.1 UDP-3-O-acylglucosamine N-acyltransferase [Cesiribacter andamanensis AMV16]